MWTLGYRKPYWTDLVQIRTPVFQDRQTTVYFDGFKKSTIYFGQTSLFSPTVVAFQYLKSRAEGFSYRLYIRITT